MATTRTVLTEASFEKKTRQLTMTFVDLAGSGFKPDVVTLTLYNAEDESIINGRSAQSIRDANGGTITTGGALTLVLSANDNIIVAPRTGKTEEKHIALIEWSRTSDGLTGGHEIEFPIAEIAKVS